LELTSGACHDAPVVETVFEHCPTMPQLVDVVMDQGYDSDAMRPHLQAREVTPVIPPKRKRQAPMMDDTEQDQ
jgi:hypothetical protein